MEPHLYFQSDASELDKKDALPSNREHFHIPVNKNGEETIYFVGHSLGLQPKLAQTYIYDELQNWKKLGVDAHFEANKPWVSYHENLAKPIGRLVGALPTEVVVMNTLTVNLHLMMISFYRPTRKRNKILIEGSAFPSDLYAIKSQIAWHGFDPEETLIEIHPKDGEDTIQAEAIEELIAKEGNTIALVFLSGVNYLTGQVFPIKKITEIGHQKGCVVGFDLAHAIGNIKLQLHDWQVDFAVWCSYKYLNGGPGCVGGFFIHTDHGSKSNLPRFSGWWGHQKATRFQMLPEFDPIPGAEGWQLSNQPILLLAALRASLELFDSIGMDHLRSKSKRLTGYLEYLLLNRLGSNISIISPEDPEQSGCKLSIRSPQIGRHIYNTLSRHGVQLDWREPDVIRLAPVPLYNTFSDVYNCVKIIENIKTST